MKKILEYDQNIIDALKKLPIPLYNSNGKKVIFDKRKRYEAIFQHIAKKEHSFKERDIELVPKIIADKYSVHNDKKSKKFKVYYGKRLGKNKKQYIKIIAKVQRNEPEMIITMYTVRKKD